MILSLLGQNMLPLAKRYIEPEMFGYPIGYWPDLALGDHDKVFWSRTWVVRPQECVYGYVKFGVSFYVSQPIVAKVSRDRILLASVSIAHLQNMKNYLVWSQATNSYTRIWS